MTGIVINGWLFLKELIGILVRSKSTSALQQESGRNYKVQ